MTSRACDLAIIGGGLSGGLIALAARYFRPDRHVVLIEAGRAGFEAQPMEPRDLASPSTPVIGTPFWHAAS